MSSSLSGYIVVFSLLAAPIVLPAQEDLAALARRADAAHATAIAMHQKLSDYRAAHPVHFSFEDSVVIASGKVKVFFNAPAASLARAAAAQAGKDLDDLGAALDPLPTYLVAVVPDTAASDYDASIGRVGAVNVEYFASVDQRTPFRTSTEPDPRAIADVILSTVGSNSSRVLAPRVGEWLGGYVPIARPLAARLDWGELRLSMVSSPSRVGRGCFMGDLAACKAYLGLDSVPDPAHALFDSTGRRLLVEYDNNRMRYASRDSYTRCIDGNDEACVAVMNIAGIGPLSSPYMRSSLLTEALDLGGPRALERLMTSQGSAGEALAAAANQPLDSLVAAWQHPMNERFGASANLPLSVVLSSLVGIGVCVVLALRSSRWR